jgi:hypothetical protein
VNFQEARRLTKRIPQKAMLAVQAWTQVTGLALKNRYSKSPLTHAEGPVVSLTTYGNRLFKVHLAIESIAQNSVLPSRLILWLDDESALHNLPPGLRRLQARGLEILLSKNYGPHTKYYPYVASADSLEKPLITADDDMLYPKYWIKGLAQAYNNDPQSVHCYRARVIALDQDGLLKYRQWNFSRSTRPSYRHLAIASTGVIYPPPLLAALRKAGEGFVECCLKTDDLWLHIQTLRLGMRIHQIKPRALELPMIPNTQQTALYRTNVKFEDGNDRNIKLAYTVADIELLRADPVSSMEAPARA